MRPVYLTLMLSAMAGLIYQLTVMDMLFSFFVRTSHTSSVVISVFLAGLGIGSYLVHRYRKRITGKKRLLIGLQFVLALYAIAVFYNLYSILPSIHPLGLALVSAVLILIPTILLGATFALVAYIVGNDRNITGAIYSTDLVGAVGGSLISGFLLIPLIGVQAAILVAATANVLAGTVLIRRYSLLLVPVTVGLLIVGLGIDVGGRPVQSDSSLEQIQGSTVDDPRDELTISFQEHTAFGTVTLQDDVLYIDRRDQCSYEYPANATERRIVDYALEPVEEEQVLNIGLGCAQTLEQILRTSPASVTVVEINSAVVEASTLKTDATTHPRVDVVIDDGYQFVRDTEETYGSIIMDVTNPAVAYSSDLYTVEAFQAIHDALDDDGTFGLWAYYCREDDDRVYNILYNTLNETFPHVYIVDRSLIIASKQELDYDQWITARESEINTIDHNVLSTYFAQECSWWQGN